MAGRTDGLPHPATVGEMYQAAILDELRGLRADLQSKAPEAAPVISFNVPDEDGTVALREELPDAGRVAMPSNMKRRGR